MTYSALLDRRGFCAVAAGVALTPWGRRAWAEQPGAFRLRYIVSSAMYGTEDLSVILPQVPKAGAEHIDLWPRPHGNQREQVERMGLERFAELLQEHGVKLGAISRYDLFPFDIREEMRVCEQLGGSVMIGHSAGPRDVTGEELRQSVAEVTEQLKPLGEEAQERGITLAIENHSNTRLHSADGMRWFAEMAPAGVGIAFAPHHLPQDAAKQAKLIEDLGDKVAFFYAQQYGTGSSEEQPREKELLQMPGRGPLDFCPLVKALKKVDFRGFTEIFMHPYPRGIPIQDTPEQVTAEINRSRAYLDACAADA